MSEQKPPLWEVMHTSSLRKRFCHEQRACEIQAVRDWLKSELPEGGAWYDLLSAEVDLTLRGERGK